MLSGIYLSKSCVWANLPYLNLCATVAAVFSVHTAWTCLFSSRVRDIDMAVLVLVRMGQRRQGGMG